MVTVKDLEFVQKLGLPEKDFAIFGSGPLLVRGIIDAANDLDVLCRGAAWEQVSAAGELQYLERYDVTVCTFREGRITFGREWGIGDVDVNELIESAEIIDGLPFARLEYVIAYKRIAGRRKDMEHLALLKNDGLL